MFYLFWTIYAAPKFFFATFVHTFTVLASLNETQILLHPALHHRSLAPIPQRTNAPMVATAKPGSVTITASTLHRPG